MRLEAKVKPRRVHGWMLAAAALAAAQLALVAALPAVALSPPVFLGMTALVTAASFAALYSTRWRRLGAEPPRRVTADARGLSIDGALVLPRQRIAMAYVRDEEGGACTVVVQGRGLARGQTLQVRSARLAQALADTLNEPPHDIAVFNALPPWAHRLRWLALLVTASPWSLLQFIEYIPRVAIGTIVLLYGIVALPMLVPQKITVGDDGILFRWAGRRRFVGFGALVAARETPLGVELDLTSGDTVEIRLTHRDGEESARRSALLARIERGAAAHRLLVPAEDEALLSRGERPLTDWLDAMRALGSGEARSYRTIAVPRERLWEVLENPAADASAREGAALALREHLDEDERERLNAVAEKTVAPRLRVALEAVGSVPDPVRLRIALEEAEELPALSAPAAKRA